MPVIKSAIKKLRQDKKREKQNDSLRSLLKESVRNAKKKKTGKAVSEAIAIIDKASKKNIIHENKAGRVKSALSKIAKPVKVKVELQKQIKQKVKTKTSKKTPKK